MQLMYGLADPAGLPLKLTPACCLLHALPYALSFSADPLAVWILCFDPPCTVMRTLLCRVPLANERESVFGLANYTVPEAISSDGTRLHYEVYGNGSPAVVLLHGMGTSDTWRPLLRHLDLKALRVVTCDLRGHGVSGGGAESFTYAQLNEDLVAVVQAAGIDRCVIVGFSGGCKNAVWFAAEQPSRVRGLVLVAPSGLGIVPLPRETVSYILDHIEKQKNIPPEFETWFSEKIGTEKESIVTALVTTSRAVLDASAEIWLYTAIDECAHDITQPVKVLAARRDVVYHPEFQRQTTLTTLPHATMEVLDCAHFIPCEEPALLARSIQRFCDDLPPA